MAYLSKGSPNEIRIIAHNLLVNYYRKVKEIPLSVFGENSEKLIQTTEDIERRCDCIMLWNAMQDLATHEQNVLILYYWDGLATKEIGGMTGKSENAIRLILSRSRKTLAKHPSINELSTIPTPEEIRRHHHHSEHESGGDEASEVVLTAEQKEIDGRILIETTEVVKEYAG